MSNRREYERLMIRKYALLKLTNGELIEGQTRNLSMSGAFIECEPEFPLQNGTECSITMNLDEEDEEMLAEIYATISHSDDDGLGCHFLKVNSTYYQFIGELYA